ncbi:type II toxin-antitoxin system RelE/ParE family toxin [Bowmanella denitrificans]|uniref:type II toxin-antitoxin system RelE/ParE family toxin n=1 Tax=Bowmanella denitrificans TaxID=366582 RepID=UPI000C9BF461|nr:type II toxin-antitoxin system RelE/ParE family toxin [Bowmanella denitrificans]
MANSFQITPRAKGDLYDAWLYTLETWGEHQADTYIQALFSRFAWLAEQPSAGRHRTDIAKGYYCFAQGQHLVFYQILQTDIAIIGVPHQSMDIEHYFDRPLGL